MMMEDLLAVLDRIAPLQLAADWDNVGLLLGWHHSQIDRVMTTLDVTEATLQEAVDRKADLIVTHHPLPFRPIQKITNQDVTGRLICEALQNGVSVYSAHTAWDNAAGGINDQLADAIELMDCQALIAKSMDNPFVGTARVGQLSEPTTIKRLIDRLARLTGVIDLPRSNYDLHHAVRRVAICCGSGGSMLPQAIAMGADALLTGEATYHQCLQATASSVAMIMIGHHRSESFAMRTLAERIAAEIELKEVWACQADQNRL